MAELLFVKPCHKCGCLFPIVVCDNVKVVCDNVKADFFVICRDCENKGPAAQTAGDAVKKWNEKQEV